jgi:hypothetical protein
MRKVMGLVLVTLALTAMAGTVSAQGSGAIEPWKAQPHSQGAIIQP